MRIIGGRDRSRIIRAPSGRDTRPTLDRVREMVFDVIQFHVPGSRVLDLFGGSGAYALEAVSRGAASAVINDHSPHARQVIRDNIVSLQDEECCRLTGWEADRALDHYQEEKLQFDLIFLDPPYEMDASPCILKIFDLCLLSPGGIVIAEYSAHSPSDGPDHQIIKRKQMGIAQVAFIHWREERNS